jgi:tetratricopeptide (TPR) repeat protein
VIIKRLLLFFLLCLSPFILQAQQLQGRPRIDSELRDLVKAGNDSQRVLLLISVAKDYHNINPDTGIFYGNAALRLSQEMNWKLQVARANSALGQNYEARTNNPSALDYYIKALSGFEDLKEDAKIAITNGNIGNVYQSLGKYDQALEYDLKALVYYKEHKDKEGIARNLGNIAVVYDFQKKDSSAEAYYNEAIKIDEEIGKKDEIAKNQGNIATLYYNRKNFVKAIALANKALGICEALDDKKNAAVNYCNIGSFYVEMVKYSKEKPAAMIGGREENLANAVHYLEKGVAISSEIGYQDGMKDGYDGLKEVYLLKGDYKIAFDYFLKYSAVKDSINSTENKIKVANIESARQIEKQKADLKILELKDKNNKQSRLIYISGIVLLLIVISVVVKYFISEIQSNRKLAKERKKHIERIRAQKTVLKDIAYIQSHEVRGPVSTILGLTQLFNYDDPADPTNKELMEGVSTVAQRLDKIVTEVVNKENKLNTAAELESDKEDNI